MLNDYFVDLHIHVGRDIANKPVKIAASKNLTLTNILKEASRRKGIDMIGVIDCHAPNVQKEIQSLINIGDAIELKDGGIVFEQVTLIPGAEIEIYDEYCCGPIHVLCYFPNLQQISSFTTWLRKRMKNITLSSQRYYGTAKELQHKVRELNGLFIPAHVFTPFKSVYGKGVQKSLTEVLNPELIDGIELGLSSDSEMADQISELHRYSFVTNSDAHSLAKIAREYQKVRMQTPSFKELYRALHQIDERRIIENYGMNPKLGKYYTTVCQNCMTSLTYGSNDCSNCRSKKIVNGVFDRIQSLADNQNNTYQKRPDYIYQVPLEYLPGLGPKTFEKLLDHFGTEMHVIHHCTLEELETVVPEKLAKLIINMREGKQIVNAGGGGKYGRVHILGEE